MDTSTAPSPLRGDGGKKFFEKGEVLIKIYYFFSIE